MFYGCMGNPLTQLQSKDSVLKSVNSPWLALSSLEESHLKYHSSMMTSENIYKETNVVITNVAMLYVVQCFRLKSSHHATN